MRQDLTVAERVLRSMGLSVMLMTATATATAIVTVKPQSRSARQKRGGKKRT